MKLGKKPHRPGAMKLQFADIFDATKLPTPPVSFGHQRMIKSHAWGMLGNDQWGDCVLAGAAHEQMLFSREGRHGSVIFDDKGVLSDYSAITGFDPNDPYTDQGTDMVEAASYRRRTGVIDSRGVRHKIDAYASITRADLAQTALAVWLFGACGIGVQWPSSAFYQFEAGKPLDVVKGDQIEGGHYMPCIARHKDGHYVLVTWGQMVLATSAWMREYMDEAVAYISFDVLQAKSQETDEGFDIAKLREFLGGLK